MRVSRVELNNYRLYKGKNELLFPEKDNKNIFLVVGQNGYGKTTFLHSLLWCLYGRLIVDIDDSIRKDITQKGGYTSYLKDNLNIDQKNIVESISIDVLNRIKQKGYSSDDLKIKLVSQYSVSIDFSNVLIPSIPCQSLRITRSYDVIRNKEELKILIDGSPNELSNEIGSDFFINDFILNKEVARFFFFDSEKIVSIAESNTIEDRRRMASAYNEVLGVKKYEDLGRNLENLRLRFRKESNDFKSRDKLNSLLEKQNELSVKFDYYEKEINIQEEYLNSLRMKNESFQIELLREGNSISIDELRRLEQLIEVTKAKDLNYKSQLKALLDYAPFAISGNLFCQTKEQLEYEYQLLKSTQNIENQNILINNITADILLIIRKAPISSDILIELHNSIQSTLETYKREKKITKLSLIKVNDEIYEEFVSVYNRITGTYRAEFERLEDDYRKNRQVLERSSRKLASIKSVEKDLLIKDIRTRKNAVEKDIMSVEAKIRSIFEAKGTLSKELALVNKQVSELKKKIRLDDSNVKKDALAEQLTIELDVFLKSLKQRKKYTLEKKICRVLNSLMHKENFIDKVKISVIDDGIDINLYSPEGSMIKKESLSKGEQQLYATSILQALVDESKIEFPVFIDSPLQKFDKSHSNKVIEEFYPNISKQVVLFPLMHKELTKSELSLMKSHINSVYLIVNEKSHSYFKQVDINSIVTV